MVGGVEEKVAEAGQHNSIVTVCSAREKYLVGPAMDKISVIENATVVIDQSGLIEAIGKDADLQERFKGCTFDVDIDCTGMSIVPGLVDAHTHPVWAGDRVHEFALKLKGATYMEIHQAGGGIGFTVRHTREASEEQLLELLLARLRRMLVSGTTLVEAKSGYGLDLENEMKMLRVLHRAKDLTPVEIVSTYLGAHSVPSGSTAAKYAEEIVTQHLPQLMELKSRGEISPENIDVFYEKNVFEREETLRILREGAKCGLNLNFHGDELNPMHAGELGGELGALAISHLEHVSDEGMAAMAKKPTFAVLLPTTAYILRLTPPPARKLIDGNVPVALGSDFNPNAHCMSMPFVMNLACVNMRMTMNEALAAATINAAGSMNRSETHGSIEVGKVGDLLLIGSPRWEHLIYELVDPPITHVVKAGKVVYSSGSK